VAVIASLAAIVTRAAPARAESNTIVISEFRFNGPNGAADEFVELYNASAAPVDIGGWQLRGSNNSRVVSVRATVPVGRIVGAHRHFLFANGSTQYSGPAADVTYATGITSDGGVAISTADGFVVDQVGLSTGSAYVEGTPLPGPIDAASSYERRPGGRAGNGSDTDDNSADFMLASPANPQNTSSPPVPANASADFDGDVKTDVALFRPTGGLWYVTGAPGAINYGRNGDVPVPGDYDGDGKADVAVFRPSTGLWATRFSGGAPDRFVTYGLGGDLPVVADYDGDGRSDMAVYRPSTGTWFVHRSSDGSDYAVTFGGLAGDVAVPGDYDGDGTANLAIFRPSSGNWYLHDTELGDLALNYGHSGDVPVPGDYDGDGSTDVGIFRRSTGLWSTRSAVVESKQAMTYGGIAGDVAVPGDYDGDGRSDIAIWRPSTGGWYVHASSTGADSAVTYGLAGDIPVVVPPSIRLTT
jgi:hypothetical protein